jgi:hypothetical protein
LRISNSLVLILSAIALLGCAQTTAPKNTISMIDINIKKNNTEVKKNQGVKTYIYKNGLLVESE